MLVTKYKELIDEFINASESSDQQTGLDSCYKQLLPGLESVCLGLNNDEVIDAALAEEIIKKVSLYRQQLLPEQYQCVSIIPEVRALNSPWIHLASSLCDKDNHLFSFHYYSLLFPEALNIYEQELSSRGMYYELPLSALFYSAHKKQLLSLEGGKHSAKSNYGYCMFWLNKKDDTNTQNAFEVYELSKDEMDLMTNINPQFIEVLGALRNKPENNDALRPLSYISLIMLGLMIEFGFYESGIAGLYNEEEQKTSEDAFYAFHHYLLNTSATENEFIKNQIIVNNARADTFKNLYGQAIFGNRCNTGIILEVISMVNDYKPDFPFTAETLKLTQVDKRPTKTLSQNSPYDNNYQTLSVVCIIIELIPYAHQESIINKLLAIGADGSIENISDEVCVSIANEALELFLEKATREQQFNFLLRLAYLSPTDALELISKARATHRREHAKK